MKKLATIIVLVHDHAKISLECFESIERYTDLSTYEVLIVNNGSSSFEAKILKVGLTRFRKLPHKVINLPKNLGFSKAANIAAKEAHSQFLVFLNNDTVVTKNWLLDLLVFMEKDPKVAACGPKIHSWQHREYFDYAGGAGGFLDIFGYPFTRGRVFDFIEKDKGQYDTKCEISWASGVCLVVRKKVFDQLRGFDEYFFAYLEEIDLCLRLRQKGYKIFCVPQSLVYHLGAATSNRNLLLKTYLNHHNSLYLILKNYSIWPYLPLLVIRLFLDLAAIFYYLSRGQLSFVLAVFGSFFKILMSLPHFVTSGVVTFKGRSLIQVEGIFKGSIVFEYFFRGRKTFHCIMSGSKLKAVDHLDYRSITYFET